MRRLCGAILYGLLPSLRRDNLGLRLPKAWAGLAPADMRTLVRCKRSPPMRLWRILFVVMAAVVSAGAQAACLKHVAGERPSLWPAAFGFGTVPPGNVGI